LTDPKVTTFMWNWLERDVNIDRSHVDMLRQVRVFKNSDDIIVSRPGRLSGVLAETTEGGADDWTKMVGEGAEEEETVPEMEVEA
jgi:translation machinery-associated protein 16